MARSATSKPASTSKAVANWDEELAAQAQTASALEANSGGGQFFSIKAGQLSFAGEAYPDNEIAVVILDAVLEHTYYEGAYDPDRVAPPTCYAFGRDTDAAAEPHPDVQERQQAQHDTCGGCPHAEFGSALQGKGRACRWMRRLALIPAGTFVNKQFHPEDDADHFAKTPVGYLKVPPTSVKYYSGMVKQVAAALKRPPHGVFTRIKVSPDPKTQLRVEFEVLGKVPDELMGTVMQRHREQLELTEFPYNLDLEAQAPTKTTRGPARGRTAPAPARGGKPKKF